jgi:uncharacterized membrane protein
MTDLAAPQPALHISLSRLREKHGYKLLLASALAGFACLSHIMLAGKGAVRLRVDLEPLLDVSPFLQAHIAGAVSCFLIGSILLLGVKGRTLHRVLGYAWVTAMAVTAISSFFVTGLNGDRFSLIHLLSGWTTIVLPMAIAAARRRDIANHRKEMTSLFFGGILVAGLFSFMPGRVMWQLFFTV